MTLPDSSTFTPLRCTQNVVQKYRKDSFFLSFFVCLLSQFHIGSPEIRSFCTPPHKQTAQLLIRGLKVRIGLLLAVRRTESFINSACYNTLIKKKTKFSSYTYKEIQKGAVAKLYMTNGLLIND
jgi:hypothetical protein